MTDENILALTVADINAYADRSGGRMPKEWRIGRATFSVLVDQMRRRLKEDGRLMVDGRDIVIEDSDNPSSLMVIGVPVYPIKGMAE
jgi:hypothetical protein